MGYSKHTLDDLAAGWGSEIRSHSCEMRNHNPWRKSWIRPATWTKGDKRWKMWYFFPDFFLLFFDMFIFSIFFHIFQLTNVIMHIYHILDFRFWIFLKPRLVHQKRGIWANISNISLVPEFIAGNEVQQMQRTFARFSPDQPVTFPDCVAKGSRL